MYSEKAKKRGGGTGLQYAKVDNKDNVTETSIRPQQQASWNQGLLPTL